MYPQIKVSKIKKPNRLWAIPFAGGAVKALILIPVGIEIVFLGIWVFFVSIANSFYVLVNGKYWNYSYKLNVGFFRLLLKTKFFFAGLTDKYPGFNLKIEDNFSLDIKKPQKPNKLFAVPVFGGLVRIILIIPFAIYTQVIKSGSQVGVVASSIPVLVNGNYPESTFEMYRDGQRLGISQSAYILGLSDTYPNFKISMNHKKIKITLIIIGTFLAFTNYRFPLSQEQNIKNEFPKDNYQNQYKNINKYERQYDIKVN